VADQRVTRVLLLGGTGEARALAALLAGRASIELTSSLAGRVRDPALPVGAVHIGGFGGVDGLGEYLLSTSTDLVIDATHPFAAGISANAAAAASRLGVPLLVLQRPGWIEGPDDVWHRVRSVEAAATMLDYLSPPGSTVLLTHGRRELAPFAGDDLRHYLIRAVDPPEGELPPNHSVLLSRGPYTLNGERELMLSEGVGTLVTKDSGGSMTEAKLIAARELGVDVVMIDRPPLPEPSSAVAVVDSVSAALGWIDAH
jgi:precorrin-6A/cobalt-precorrin-6A reductase